MLFEKIKYDINLQRIIFNIKKESSKNDNFRSNYGGRPRGLFKIGNMTNRKVIKKITQKYPHQSSMF